MLQTTSVLPGAPQNTRRDDAVQVHGLRQELSVQGVAEDAQVPSAATRASGATVGRVPAEVDAKLESGRWGDGGGGVARGGGLEIRSGGTEQNQ